MNDIITEDIHNLINSLVQSYNSNFSLQFLYERYRPNIIIQYPKIKKKKE